MLYRGCIEARTHAVRAEKRGHINRAPSVDYHALGVGLVLAQRCCGYSRGQLRGLASSRTITTLVLDHLILGGIDSFRFRLFGWTLGGGSTCCSGTYRQYWYSWEHWSRSGTVALLGRRLAIRLTATHSPGRTRSAGTRWLSCSSEVLMVTKISAWWLARSWPQSSAVV